MSNAEPSILVVDDNTDNLELVSQVLEDDYGVITADSGAECIRLAMQEDIDVILLDVMMPEMDGYEVLQLLRGEEKTKDIPVIFLTARYKDIDRVVKGLSLGAFDYITKPFEDDILLARVGVAIRVKEVEDKIRKQTEELTAANNSYKNFNRSIDAISEKIIESGGEKSIAIDDKDNLDAKVTLLAETYNKAINTNIKTRKELSENKNLLEEMVDHMVNAVITIDENGIVLSFNSSAEKMFGYQAIEVVGRNVSILMPDDIANNHNGYISNYVKTGEKNIMGTGRDLVAKNKQGETLFIHLTISELPKKEGQKRTFIGSCLDISLQKTQEEQLRRSQKMQALGTLTGGISHDYNNMLGIISGYAGILKKKLDDATLNKFVDEIINAAKRGEKMTKKLLRLSSNVQDEPALVNVNDVLGGIEDMLATAITARIKLTLELAELDCATLIDQNDFEDAILNLAINAMHAMEDGGDLLLSTSVKSLSYAEAINLNVVEGEYVVISIKDNGTGIEPETKAKIFDPFFSTKGERGTGLGLSQVYGFAKRSDGAIDVLSEQGTGTTFFIYLPCTGDASDVESVGAEVDSSKYSGTESILFVDDEISFHELMANILEPHGYKVKTAAAAKDALTLLSNNYYDLLISDVIMPEMDGHQLVGEVESQYPEIKILIASGFSENKNRELVSSKVLQQTIDKPFNPEKLLKKVRIILDS